jgi:hypothetical protein
MEKQPRSVIIATTFAKKAALSTGFAVVTAGAAVCLHITGTIGTSPSANALYSQGTATASTTPPSMNLTGSPDQTIDTDGTQGSFKPAMDGTTGIGDQCTSLSASIACETQSPAASPQYKAK